LDLPAGNQGGAVARSLVKNKNFAVRGITRNPDSDAAKVLASIGVEVVKADGFNKDEMKAAFTGSWGAFVNTQSEDSVMNSNLDDGDQRHCLIIYHRASTSQVAPTSSTSARTSSTQSLKPESRTSYTAEKQTQRA
jgi:uncharacterized protein YbjT (DUF2867 family)